MNPKAISAGLRSAKLIARNEQLRHKMMFFSSKVIKLREQIGVNEVKIRELLAQERLNRKYKVD